MALIYQDKQTKVFLNKLATAKQQKTILNFFKFISFNRILSIMEHQKIFILSNEANDSKFVTRKWNIINDNPKANYNVGNEIIYNIEVLKSNLCDYNDAYILVKGNITFIAAPLTKVAFKNCPPFY